MGVLNVTPDSFYDGGSYCDSEHLLMDKIVSSAANMVAQGAAIIDIGGESTRPGASPVSIQEECDRVLPVVERLGQEVDVVLSVDTSTPEVMTGAAGLGVGIINDVRALERPGALEAAIATQLPICLMHMQGTPATMQDNPHYADASRDVREYLQARVNAVLAGAVAAGLSAPQLLLDPGFGFGKTDEHNLALLRGLAELQVLGYPLLVGFSRKSMIGRLLGREPDERLAGSLALAMLSVQRGASIVRVHDVAETRDVLKLLQIIESGSV